MGTNKAALIGEVARGLKTARTGRVRSLWACGLKTARASCLLLLASFGVMGQGKRIVVAQDGAADYRTVQAALDAVPLSNVSPVTIFIRNGLYHEKLHLDATKDYVTLTGEDAVSTILTYSDHPGMVSPKGDSIDTRSSHSFLVQGNDFRAENITFRNDAGYSAGQAVALEVQGDREVFMHCRIIGNQDILFLNGESSRQYYGDCYIEGTTDFIFGPATAWFDHCRIYSKKNSYVTAASTPPDHYYGFVFNACTLEGDTALHNVSLGRPWKPYAAVDYIHCTIGAHIKPEGWANWNKTENYKTARYAEYKNEGPGAGGSSRVPWARQLGDEEADKITIKNVFGGWEPAGDGVANAHEGSGVGASNVQIGAMDGKESMRGAGEPNAHGGAEVVRDYSWENLPVIHAPAFRRDTFDITRYGARADGISLNTAAIDSAIADCSRKGGGVVLVPAGLWLTGPIVLQTGVNLHIDRAAILQFSGDFAQYPLVEGNWEGHAATRCQPPISGTDLHNIAITGTGIIDGNGDGWRMLVKDKVTDPEWKRRIASGGSLSEDGKTWYPADKHFDPLTNKKTTLRPNLVVLTRCDHVLLEGATFQNSPAWCLHFLLCEDLTVRDVHVRNPSYAQNGDGTDIESCRNVLVEASTFDAGDDGICIKSGRDEEGRKRGKPTENVIIRNDIVYRAHGGFVIGSEMSGGARNIFVYDCSFLGTDIGLRFKTVRGRGGVVEKIYIRNINMRDIVHQAVFLDMYYFAKAATLAETNGQPSREPVPPVTEATPGFRDIHITGIVCDGAAEGIFIRGLPEMSIRDIYLDNMMIKATKGAELIAAKNISFRNIRLLTQDTDPVIYVENSSELRFDSVTCNPGAGLLFSINGDQCGAISVSGTDMGKAVRKAAFNYGAKENMLEVLR